jgi:hypothetical protein
MYNVKDIIDNYPDSFEEYDKLVAEIATVLHRHEAVITCYSLDTLNKGWGAFCEDPKKYEGTVVVDMINQDLGECVPFSVTIGVDNGGPESGPIVNTCTYCVFAIDEQDAEAKVSLDIDRDFGGSVEGYSIEKMSDEEWAEYLNDYEQ